MRMLAVVLMFSCPITTPWWPCCLQEDPKTLLVVPSPLPKDQVFERLAWGPDGTIAAAYGTHVHFLSSQTGEVLEVVHAHEAPLSGMHWAPQRVPLGDAAHPVAVLATCSSDRRVRFWRSPAPAQED
jgi:WD40 repeat protein